LQLRECQQITFEAIIKEVSGIQEYKLLYRFNTIHILVASQIPPTHIPNLRVVLNIDDCFLPLASRYLALEQDIDLTVGPTLHLRKEKVGHNEAKETSGTPHVAALSAKVTTL
jgi:hypothetical protein